MLTDGLEWCGLLVDYCDVFVILTNHTSMESLFIKFSGDVKKTQFQKKLPVWLFLWSRFKSWSDYIYLFVRICITQYFNELQKLNNQSKFTD